MFRFVGWLVVTGFALYGVNRVPARVRTAFVHRTNGCLFVNRSRPVAREHVPADAPSLGAAASPTSAGKGAFAEAREAVFRKRYLDGIDLAAEIRALRETGVTGYRDIAEALNARGVPTPRGGRWHPSSVHRQVKRLGVNVPPMDT